ncbi:MAG: enoyl-CoA hydratase/isomerase family protein [Allosphingosinicella sp.]
MFDLAVSEGVARLRLDRPRARNAIPVEGWERLAELLGELGDARLLLLSGEREAFCAGADLEDFPRLMEDEAAASGFRLAMRSALDALAGLEIVTAALVEGPCYGAGVALAMACDLRIAGPGARFAVTPAKFAISYPQEDVARLVALVGPGQASRLLLGAGSIDAGEAARIGLVEILAEDPASAVAALAEAILANSPESIATLKRGIRLAAAGVPRDETQDKRFDALFGGSGLGERFAALRPRR